jgi:SAM-dependent methyltransferase
MTRADIFSRATRRRYRDRAFASDYDSRWLTRLITTELSERLSAIKRTFENILIIGNDGGDLQRLMAPHGTLTVIADCGFRGAASAGGVQCDEDRLPFADASFDLVLAPGGLDTVNDLPGALLLIRRILKPDGLFLGAMAGAGGLETLRGAILATAGPDKAVARHHPQIDVRSAGDLLVRAGFALPVAESQSVSARYSDFFRLIGDLRANAITNALVKREMLQRAQLAQMADYFSAIGDPKTEEIFALIFMIGWAPSTGAPATL